MNPAQQKLHLAASLFEYLLHATSENEQATYDKQLQQKIVEKSAEMACDMATIFMNVASKKFGFHPVTP
jgi:hypothetical protein